MHQHRFLQPAVPVLMLLVAWAGRYLGEMGRSRRGKALLAVTVVLVFLSQPLRIFSHVLRHPNPALAWPPGLIQPWDGYSNPYLNYHLGLQMRDIMPADATVALIPVGAFGYSCGRTVIDMLGLNDREIAHQPSVAIGKGRMGHEKGDGNLILARRPDFILLRGNPNPTLDEVAPPDEELGKYIPIRQIWNSESFQKNYEPFVVKVDDKYSFTVYRRIARESMTSVKESRWNSSSTL